MPLTLSDRKNIRPLNGAVVRTYEAGALVNVGDFVYLNPANDRVLPARANADATTYAIGMVVSVEGVMPGTAAQLGQAVGVCVEGPVAGLTGMDAAIPMVWLSAATAGAATQTKPTGASNRVFALGRPIRTDVFLVRPQVTEAVAGV